MVFFFCICLKFPGGLWRRRQTVHAPVLLQTVSALWLDLILSFRKLTRGLNINWVFAHGGCSFTVCSLVTFDGHGKLSMRAHICRLWVCLIRPGPFLPRLLFYLPLCGLTGVGSFGLTFELGSWSTDLLCVRLLFVYGLLPCGLRRTVRIFTDGKWGFDYPVLLFRVCWFWYLAVFM